MKFTLTTKTLIISAAVLLVGAAVALAHGGNRDGDGGHMMGSGMGRGMMGNCPNEGMGPGMMNGPRGQGHWGNLTDAQRTQLDAAREKFFDETQALRDQIQDKQHAMQEEFAKSTPDEGAITNLQKELSKLEGEFDQKAVLHRLEVHKLLPENARRGLGRGYCGGNCRQ